jgi:hypothetical protein
MRKQTLKSQYDIGKRVALGVLQGQRSLRSYINMDRVSALSVLRISPIPENVASPETGISYPIH